MGGLEVKELAFVGKHRMIVTVARQQPQKDRAPQHLDTTQKHYPQGSAIANRHLRKVVHRLYVNRCPDVANYPAARAFSKSP
jgi:hypothetical protein